MSAAGYQPHFIENGDIGVSQPGHLGHDARLLRRAFREKWPVTPEHKQKVVDEMVAVLGVREHVIVTSDGPVTVSNARNQTAAAKVLIAAEGQNQADEHLAIKAEIEANRPPSVVNLTQTNIYANLPADKRAELESFKAMLEGGS